MAEVSKREHNVVIKGYLKENTLELIKTQKGSRAIRGNLMVALNENESFKVQYYVGEFTSTGDPAKAFEGLYALLPEKTTSIVGYLKENYGSKFQEAAKFATKIWVNGYFDEYLRRNENGDVVTSVQIRGRRAGLAAANEEGLFTPKAEFKADVYVYDIKEEEKEGNKTGRIVLTGLIPNYDQSVTMVDFIAPTDGNVATYILSNYHNEDTVRLEGNLLNVYIRKEVAPSEDFFGSAKKPQYETEFINERLITGGSSVKAIIHQGQPGSLSTAEAKLGLNIRLSKVQDYRPRVAPTAKAGFNDDEDVDF